MFHYINTKHIYLNSYNKNVFITIISHGKSINEVNEANRILRLNETIGDSINFVSSEHMPNRSSCKNNEREETLLGGSGDQERLSRLNDNYLLFLMCYILNY